MTVFQDIFEPVQVKQLLEQVVPVVVVPLNGQGLADYQWVAVDGHTIQVERKQIDEILSDINHVEEQLGREIVHADETILVWEGAYEPISGVKPSCQSWRKSHKGDVMVPSRKYALSYALVQAWFYQLDKCGITSFNTSDYTATAIALGAWYMSSQKPEHTTMRRYIKEHITPSIKNPHVHNLMAIKGAEIGEAKAKALIDRFGTFWYTVNQEVDMLASTIIGERKDGATMRFGEVAARKLLKAIGRIK